MLTMCEIAAITGGNYSGADVQVGGFSIDTRSLSKDDLFVAIPGEVRDGHTFVDTALQTGASGALVSKKGAQSEREIVVEDTTTSLGEIAASWRERFGIPVVGITGSNGKTTVTALVKTILERAGNVLSPVGSFNNQWGVPLTLLRMQSAHTHAVIEMGMNHPGEIDRLTRIARPSVAVINNAAAAHLEGLGTIENVARAKAEIITGVSADGTIVLNADDPFYDYWVECAESRRVVSFGSGDKADVTARSVRCGLTECRFELVCAAESREVSLPLSGHHNVMNALAAASVAHALSIDLNVIVSGLEHASPVAGRLIPHRLQNEVTIIDDTYNANPESMRAAIQVLSERSNKKVLVLGPMAELGDDAAEAHRSVGEFARQSGIDVLLTFADSEHPFASGYQDGFGKGGQSFHSLESLIDCIDSIASEQATVLCKGSRSSAMERVVEALLVRAGSGKTKTKAGADQC
ncbi:MAG: UDP-N-acetylmuramoyl-tripeptide--D-alanyl-D-alanine ligase [Pseudomonadota bacterium]